MVARCLRPAAPWLALAALAVTGGQALAQTALAQKTGSAPIVATPEATVAAPAPSANTAPSLAARIDPIVPPVQRVAPPTAQAPGPLVAAVKRTKASLSMLKRQAAAAVRPATTTPAVAPPAPVAAQPAQAGVQAVGPPPAKLAKKTTRAAPLALEKRSALGRGPSTAQAATKPTKPALTRLANATKASITRAKPKR